MLWNHVVIYRDMCLKGGTICAEAPRMKLVTCIKFQNDAILMARKREMLNRSCVRMLRNEVAAINL
jgi:hypothetical protein